jgi:hypothetical protein
MAKKKKGIFGLTDDIISVGGGIATALVLDVVLNKISHGRHHRRPGEVSHDTEPMPDPSPMIQPVVQGIEAIEDMTGLPKRTIVKGAAALGLLVAAEKMPQYGGVLKIAAAVMAYQAISSHPMVSRMTGGDMQGVTLADMNAIEDKLKADVQMYKEKLEAIEGDREMNAIEDSPTGAYGVELNGQVLAGSPYDATGQRIADIGAPSPFGFMMQ